MINLISDTVTKPTAGMLRAMWSAEVGDDVFREDPTVNALEEKAAAMFGHEAGLFCPSGTMANQIALKVHTRPMDEVICDEMSHIFQYEVGGYAFHSGIGVNLLHGEHGILSADMVAAAVKAPFDWLPRSTLAVIENTCNKGGGSIYPLERIRAIRQVCREKGLRLHMDGARIFNALVETGERPDEVGRELDSLSVCLSKGLGAPVGSLLIGGQDFIREARRVRKVMGGGMRQAGYLAAAGIYALDHQVERLRDDHDRARQLAQVLAALPWVGDIRPVQTNILIFDVHPALTPAQVLAHLKSQGILASAFGPQTIRFVLHLDVSQPMVDRVGEVLRAAAWPPVPA
ncbi:MAG TPA: GntG family PLP-dependent aldolase [Saprospiraceae bacterium]|nr:GntG family PLP-dependent aldolase [Saprospiraceae bacterium]HND88297.1 GntG family PLP-dependent aldolase [Saprospiraceae bacterium]HNG88643.1 GntG family PLP-dependent aldolase [Saprospiraceae bacterium]